jgi:hypothetical protein
MTRLCSLLANTRPVAALHGFISSTVSRGLSA